MFVEGQNPEPHIEMTLNPGSEGDGLLPPGVYSLRVIRQSEESGRITRECEIVDGPHAGRRINTILGERRAKTEEPNDASRARRKVRRQSREAGGGGRITLRPDGTSGYTADSFDGEET